MTTKLNDLQLVLLSTAAARADGSLLPLPESVTDQLARNRKAIPSLLKRALVAEVDFTDPALAWRDDGDRHIGAVITTAGRTAIGVDEPVEQEQQPGPSDASGFSAVAPQPEAVSPRLQTKAATVLALLRREQGATLAELVAATGWLPHTTRAALTGLRKKGHALDKSKREEATCYRIAEAA